MVATSKGYRPPLRLLEAFLCVVHETAACSVRDSTDSCRHRRRRFRNNAPQRPCASLLVDSTTTRKGQPQQQQQRAAAKNFVSDEFPVPHPKTLLFPAAGRDDDGDARACVGSSAAAAADAAVANIRRALLMRVSYGGMAFDQALLKGACLAWGERCGHSNHCALCGDPLCLPSPPRPPSVPGPSAPGAAASIVPFGYAHKSVLSALEGNAWTAFLAAAHQGAGMPPALRLQLLAHVAGTGNGVGEERAGEAEGAVRPRGSERERKMGGSGMATTTGRSMLLQPNRLGPIIREADAILSGVDFHCSGVIDELLKSTSVAARVGEAIHRCCGNRRNKKRKTQPSQAGAVVVPGLTPATAAASGAVASGGLNGESKGEGRRGVPVRSNSGGGGAVVRNTCPPTGTDGNAHGGSDEESVGVRHAAKQAMWTCSGGLNVRRLRVAFSSGEGDAGVCRDDEEAEEEGEEEGARDENGGRTSSCCCWSSPGFLKETVAVGPGEGDYLSQGSRDGGGGDGDGGKGEGEPPSDMDSMVWTAMSSDVLGWTRKFVRARLARG